MSGSLQIDRSTLDHLAPFNLLWTGDGQLIGLSRMARTYFQITDSVDQVCIVHPFEAPLTATLFPELTHLIIRIAPTVGSARALKGELVYLEKDKIWLFSGMPPIDSIGSLERMGVQLSQLPLHLGLGDVLLATESARVSLAESRRVQTALRTSTAALRERSAQLELEQIRLHREVLEHQDARRQLEAALEDLRHMQNALVHQERLKAVGEMVGGVAHDFNNILTPIVAYGGLLHLQLSDSVDPDRLGLIETILTAAQDARALIERLQRLYRPDDTQVEYSTFSIERLASDALGMARPRWKKPTRRGARRVLQHFDATGEMTGIESDLRRALLNLLFNAADATEDGGIITIHTWSDTDAVILAVTDTGHGMGPQTLEKATLPFFSTKGDTGTGLGLPMVFESAVRHGGHVLIESERGVGTRVSLSLPRTPPGHVDADKRFASSDLSDLVRIRAHLDLSIARPDFGRRTDDLVLDDEASLSGSLDRYVARASTPPDASDLDRVEHALSGSERQIFGKLRADLSANTLLAAPAMPHVRLLIVDDDPLVNEALARVAVSQGHEVVTATGALQAIERFDTRPFDLVICDLNMPGMRGDALLSMLRKQRPDATLVLYTATPDGVDDQGRDAADFIMAKPTDPAEVLRRSILMHTLDRSAPSAE